MRTHFFILAFSLWFLTPYVKGEGKYCAPQCKCVEMILNCDGILPETIPEGISALVLRGFDLRDNSLKNASKYGGIIKLDIYASEGGHILDDHFNSFENLEYLGIHGDKLNTIDSSAFAGLEGLKTLNLSSSPNLNESFIRNSMNSENRTVLPKLESLSIAYISTVFNQPIELNGNFFKSITSGRMIKYLDISGLNILLNLQECYNYACNTIETLVAKDAIIAYVVNFLSIPTCTSLKTLDISGAQIPAIRIGFSFDALDFFQLGLIFYFNVEALDIEKINTHTDLRIYNFYLPMQICPMKVQMIKASRNKIKWFNMTVNLHEVTKKSLKELNLSFNEMEYMSLNVLRPSVNLKILDLSHNNLGIMEQSNQYDFEILFSTQYKLEALYISHNNLIHIPYYTFRNNTMLRSLDISFNQIETLSFGVDNLIHLEQLFAEHNRIQTISSDFRTITKWLFSNVTKSVKLQGNSFQCTCTKESRSIIEWLSSEQFIDRTTPLYCDLDGRQADIRTAAVGDTKQYCTLQDLKTIAAFGLPTLFLVSIIIIIVSVLLVRKQRRDRAFKMVVSQIENGTFPMKFISFLSFSSDDMELVMTRIYPKLSICLSEMLHSQKQHVCVGDRHFRPGFSLRCELMKCIEESSVFIAVVSDIFCEKPWCVEEFKEAYEQNKPIIIVLLGHVDKNAMHPFIKRIFNKNVHASWIPDADGGHLEPNWNLFCKSVIELAGQNEQSVQVMEAEQFV